MLLKVEIEVGAMKFGVARRCKGLFPTLAFTPSSLIHHAIASEILPLVSNTWSTGAWTWCVASAPTEPKPTICMVSTGGVPGSAAELETSHVGVADGLVVFHTPVQNLVFGE